MAPLDHRDGLSRARRRDPGRRARRGRPTDRRRRGRGPGPRGQRRVHAGYDVRGRGDRATHPRTLARCPASGSSCRRQDHRSAASRSPALRQSTEPGAPGPGVVHGSQQHVTGPGGDTRGARRPSGEHGTKAGVQETLRDALGLAFSTPSLGQVRDQFGAHAACHAGRGGRQRHVRRASDQRQRAVR